jgi:hypothetical protein
LGFICSSLMGFSFVELGFFPPAVALTWDPGEQGDADDARARDDQLGDDVGNLVAGR